ncbi:MAG TPA: hypothetical protein VMS38_18820, partial [Pseudorhodoferax sp.]|nr:hypothetical protein [Pseudorhodoferax sp.]
CSWFTARVARAPCSVSMPWPRLISHLALSVPRGAPCAELLLQLSAIDAMLGFDEKISGQAIAIAQAGAG